MGTNLRAMGYDMYTNPVRRKAMSHARDSGEATLSGKIKLVQETSEDIQAGVLMYIPYYGVEQLPDMLEQRRSSLVGYVYAPFRMKDFICAVLGADLEIFHLKIFDGKELIESSLLFDSDEKSGQVTSSRFRRIIPVSVYGQTWTLEAASRPVV